MPAGAPTDCEVIGRRCTCEEVLFKFPHANQRFDSCLAFLVENEKQEQIEVSEGTLVQNARFQAIGRTLSGDAAADFGWFDPFAVMKVSQFPRDRQLTSGIAR